MSSTRIGGRVKALERRTGPQIVTCPTCGGPVPGVNGLIYLNEDHEPKYGKCASCGLALTPEGKPMCPHPVRNASDANMTCAVIGVDWENL